jgi:hypothetical protein
MERQAISQLAGSSLPSSSRWISAARWEVMISDLLTLYGFNPFTPRSPGGRPAAGASRPGRQCLQRTPGFPDGQDRTRTVIDDLGRVTTVHPSI